MQVPEDCAPEAAEYVPGLQLMQMDPPEVAK
jgi:hypothetical protein